MNLQLDHFSDVIQTLKSRGVCARACPLTHNILLHFAARPRVEHGSHNVSRWMTWLSISLKNAAACDKWYQLQNHSITESLNANGAWEKPFVGHPRACRTQCRTNKKSPHLESPSPALFRRFSLLKLRVQAQARHLPKVRGRLAWCLLCGSVCPAGRRPAPSREAGAAKRVPKRNIAFSLCAINILILFTDLSVAGLPAELKHITQRRKRKQP